MATETFRSKGLSHFETYDEKPNLEKKKEERKKRYQNSFSSGCTPLNKAFNMADVKTCDVSISISRIQTNGSIYGTVCTKTNSCNSTFNVISAPTPNQNIQSRPWESSYCLPLEWQTQPVIKLIAHSTHISMFISYRQ